MTDRASASTRRHDGRSVGRRSTSSVGSSKSPSRSATASGLDAPQLVVGPSDQTVELIGRHDLDVAQARPERALRRDPHDERLQLDQVGQRRSSESATIRLEAAETLAPDRDPVLEAIAAHPEPSHRAPERLRILPHLLPDPTDRGVAPRHTPRETNPRLRCRMVVTKVDGEKRAAWRLESSIVLTAGARIGQATSHSSTRPPTLEIASQTPTGARSRSVSGRRSTVAGWKSPSSMRCGNPTGGASRPSSGSWCLEAGTAVYPQRVDARRGHFPRPARSSFGA